MRKTMAVDIETYSSVDLPSAGVYAYTEAPDFEILLIAFRFNDDPVDLVRQIDCTRVSETPEDALNRAEFFKALTDPAIIKTAFNAAFERTCLAKWRGEPMPPEQWRCTMVHALELSLPGSLAGAGMALGLPEEELKDPRGKSLIQFFSKPCRPTRTNGGRTRNLPAHDPDKWELYKQYNRQDVITEQAILQRLEQYPVPDSEQKLWELDQTMNDRGVLVDVDMVAKIVEYDERRRQELQEEARALTGLSNPNSLAQLKDWLARMGVPVDTLRKDDLERMVEQNLPAKVTRVLEIRQALGKTSTAKYATMLGAVCEDHRLRGILQFYGANRSGRWAGRLVQVHNLAKNSLPDLQLARELAKAGDFDTMQTLFGETAFVFSELVRTAFIASPGRRLVVSDFSAIEARVIGWLAGEQWLLDAFRAGKDVYCETASQMYHVPVVKHGENGHLRQKGKIAVLACIAEGQKVLTDRGLVPIEKVTPDLKVWDGIEWVRHEGVIYRGKREVINYGGLEATADHIVWAEVDGTYQPVQFRNAAASGARLLQSGAGREAIRLGEDHQPGAEIHEGLVGMLRPDRVHGLRASELDTAGEPDAGKIEGVPELQPTPSGSAVAGSEADRGKATVRESKGPAIQELRREGDPLRVPQRNGRGPLHDRDLRIANESAGDRQDRQRRQLCAGESPVGDAERAERQQTRKQEIPVYDILNAGPRNRFTVSGVLVHNCGYQGGVGAMKAMDKGGSIPEEELQGVVDQWRKANPKIVKLWYAAEEAAKRAISEHRTVRLPRGVAFSYTGGNLFVRLPSGRRLCYWQARLRSNAITGREQIVYKGVNQTTKQWTDVETYGGKLVENIVQATARDCLATAMTRVAALGYEIVMHVHDEMIVDVPTEDTDALARINACMAEPIDWAPGLPLKGDGYETPFYLKD